MFACIHIPDFPVEAVLRLAPELRGGALAVVDGAPPVLYVIGASAHAREAGVETGMTQLQAAGRLPGLEIRKRVPAQETAAAAALLDVACACSPRVEQLAPDTVLLDVAGLERLFGEPPALARTLAKRAADVGLEANVAIAANAETALHAARGFAGNTVIPHGREAERLAPLPVDVLANPTDERDRELLETFDRWGVRTLRALAALPEVAVSERLGSDGLRWRRWAHGQGSRTLRHAEPPAVFEEAVELEYPAELLEPLAFVLNRMLEQLCARLSARALATNKLQLRMQLECVGEIESAAAFESEIKNQKSQIENSLTLPVPMLDAKVFLKLLQLELRAHPPQAPVAKLWLRAEPVAPRFTQGGLFLPTAPEPEKLELTLARIGGVLGETKSRAGHAEVLNTHRPDAFTVQRFVAVQIGTGETKSEIRNQKSEIELRTALRRFRPPLAANVILRDGRPARLHAGEHAGDVAWAAGPWRASGDWWEQNAWSRETWDVAVNGAVYRIFRNDEKKWFVEGTYD